MLDHHLHVKDGGTSCDGMEIPLLDHHLMLKMEVHPAMEWKFHYFVTGRIFLLKRLCITLLFATGAPTKNDTVIIREIGGNSALCI